MCINCLNTLEDIRRDQEELRKSRVFEIQNICRTCGHFKKDEWGELVGYCEVKKLSVSGVSICSVNSWTGKKGI